MACHFEPNVMCSSLKYFDNFYNFTVSLIKSFPENINFANTISIADARRVHFVPNWKVGSHHQLWAV